jgi:hypothetical protein
MVETLGSSFEARLRRCRHDLTLDVFTRHGPFWEAINDLRSRWNITPEIGLPRKSGWIPFPPACPEYHSPPDEWEEVFSPEADRWVSDIHDVIDRVMPSDCRGPGESSQSHGLWTGFLAACALYDPAPDQLVEFADRCPPRGEQFSGFGWPTAPIGEDGYEGLPRMVAPPIVSRDPERVFGAWNWFVGQLLRELGRQLEPMGGDVFALTNSILKDKKLRQEFYDRMRPEPNTAFIRVTPETTDEDVRSAFKAITRGFGVHKTRGRPPWQGRQGRWQRGPSGVRQTSWPACQIVRHPWRNHH